MKLYTIEQIRTLEKTAIRHGITESQLMQSAAESALDFLMGEMFENTHRLIIFCGTGNNGGDGYTLARLAAVEESFHVQIRHVGSLKNLTEQTKSAMKECEKIGIEIKPFDKNESLFAPIYIDALLGIGIKNEVKSEYEEAIEFINNRFGVFCLSLDVPSGIDANTGKALGSAVHADATITFIGQKLGLVTGEGFGHAGYLAISDLGIPEHLFNAVDPHAAETIDPDELFLKMPFRKKYMHKGYFGHVLIIGGDIGMNGAPLMTGLGALRSGAGLVTIATHPDHAKFLNINHPEIMCHGISQAEDLKPLMDKATVIAIGPGLGQDTWGQSLLKAVLQTEKPLVVDADALNLLAKHPMKKEQWVITPHPGEAARLLKTETKDIENNRYAAVKELQKQFGGIAVLKGSGTLIKNDSDDVIKVCIRGNAGMATAGMGDVLTGVIAGLLAQGLPPHHAAECGVYFHASAGDAVAVDYGMRGMMSTDILPYIQSAVNFDTEVFWGKNAFLDEDDSESNENDVDFFEADNSDFISH